LLRLTQDVASLFEQGGTLIVPSRARAHAARLAHAAAALAAGRRVWSSPDVIALTAWTRREAERLAAEAGASVPRVLSAAEEWLLWRQCAFEVTQGLDLLDRPALGESLQRASALAAEFGIALQAGPADSEAALLVRAQREFAARCTALSARSAATVLTAASLSPRPGGVPPMLRGFDVLPRRLAELTGSTPRNVDLDSRVPEALLLAADEREELERIAAWCVARVRERSDARLLVVLPGAAGSRQRLAALIRQALDPRGSVGVAPAAEALVAEEDAEPLTQVPLIRCALTTLGLLQGGQVETGEWSRWLRSAQLGAPSQAARARLDARLRERAPAALTLRELLGALQVLPRELQPHARELAAQLTRAVAVLQEGSAAPRQWAERWRDAVRAAWGLAEAAASGRASQPLLAWHELLEEFGQLTGSVPVMARTEALSVLADLAARTPLRRADEDASVTLSSALADPVVDYDGMWVAGLHADVFPQPVQPNPFLPLAAQRAAAVPAASAEGRIRLARELLRAWQAHAGELVLSAPARAEDLELLPSPLLAVAPAARAPDGVSPVHTGWLAARMHRDQRTETFRDERGRNWNPAEPLPRGTYSLALQNTCPFRAYAELRLGATRPEIPTPGVPFNIRGQLLHAALERLWVELVDSRALRALPAEALAALIARCVQEAAAQLAEPQDRRRHRAPTGQIEMFREIPRALARDCRRAEQLIAALCQLDRSRGEFRVTSTEGGLDLRLAGARLRMRVDRIDELAEGGLIVLDYKTGTYRTGDWYGERPAWPQLLAYLAALGEEVAALAAVWVNARELRFDGVSRTADLLPGVGTARAERGTAPEAAWEARRHDWRAILERLIGEFLAGEARLDPKPGACRNCPVISICRIDERSLARADAAVEEGADE
jgi:ATP-dependent helicase/nuclease subunit B